MNTAENTSAAPVILAARRVSMQDRYSMERLRDLSLEIRRGDVIALIGASEPAKRLLLRCLDLLDKPEGGNVELNGEPVMWRRGGADRARRSIGMAFSRESLFHNLSVMENMLIAPADKSEEDDWQIFDRAKKLRNACNLRVEVACHPLEYKKSDSCGNQQFPCP